MLRLDTDTHTWGTEYTRVAKFSQNSILTTTPNLAFFFSTNFEQFLSSFGQNSGLLTGCQTQPDNPFWGVILKTLLPCCTQSLKLYSGPYEPCTLSEQISAHTVLEPRCRDVCGYVCVSIHAIAVLSPLCVCVLQATGDPQTSGRGGRSVRDLWGFRL